ncbi:MAG: hypothetical protein GF355_03085, partial [Candidatus Eisenbacteria bacterium]|nr:hypothetical protein [Candidatus Eisenbacteria bacterium]
MARALFLIGFVSILGQVALLRELNVAFYGSELVYALTLGFWMLWTGLGAAVGRRQRAPREVSLHLLLLALAAVLPPAAVLIRSGRLFLGGVPGAYLSFPTQLLLMNLAVLPVGWILGLSFRWGARLHITAGRTAASAYAVESAGGVAGGLAATLALKWSLPNLGAVLIAALIIGLAAAGWSLRRGTRRGHRTALALGGGLLALAAAGGLIRLAQLDRALTAWSHPDLVAVRDTPYSRVTVTARGGQVAVFINDALAYETQSLAAERFVHLAALQRPRPGRILILGGGFTGLVREALAHQPDSVHYVELDAQLLELVRAHLPDEDRRALAAVPVRTSIDDPRAFVAGTERRYDLILIGMPDPDSGQLNRFYTREFFALCAERLTARGVLALRLASAENLWTPHQAQRTAAVFNALGAACADAVLLPGEESILLASPAPLARRPDALVERLVDRPLDTRLVTPAYVDYIYTNDRFHRAAERLAAAPDIINT